MWSKKKIVLLILISIFVSSASFAAPTSLTYQGRIIKSDGTPLEYNNVSFIFQVTDPSGQCVIYQEQANGINMANSAGVFDIPIGNGTIQYPLGGTTTILDAFNNSASFTCGSCSSANGNYTCANGSGTYAASATDVRKLRVSFYDGSGWKLITPDNTVRSVPFAGYALSAQKLGTHVETDFLFKAGLPTCGAGTFLSYDGTSLNCVPVAGASGGTVTSVTSTNSYLTVINNNSAPALTVNVGTAAGTVAAGDDSRLSDARTPTGAAGGALSGSYPSPGLADSSVTTTKITDGAVSTSKLFSNTGINRLVATDSNTGSTLAAMTCAAGQLLTWNIASGWQCSAQSSLAVGSSTVAGSATNFTGNLVGDVSGTQSVTSVDKIKGVPLDFSVAPTNGQVLKYNGTHWAPAADTNSGGTVTNVSSANIDIAVANGSSTPVLTLNSGTGANQIVKLDASAKLPAVDASQLINLQASQIPNLDAARITTGTFSVVRGGTGQSSYTDGQLLIGNTATGSLSKATLAAGSGVTITNGNGTISISATGSGGTVTSVTGTAPINVATGNSTPVVSLANGSSTGQVHRWDGTSSWVATKLNYTDLVNASAASPWPASTCSTGQAVTWSSVSDSFSCSTLSIATTQLTGTLAAAQIPAFTGDVTSPAGSTALTLANSGATAGTYTSVTVDAKGRVTAGTNPTTLSGYGITDAVKNLSGTPGIQTGLDAGKPAAPNAGTIYFATDTNTIYQYNSGAWAAIASANGSGGTITALTGDVTASGTGSVAATVASVGGSSAANINSAVVAVNTNATSSSTASVLVKRDPSGVSNFKGLKLDGATSGTLTQTVPAAVTSYSVTWPSAVAGIANSVLASDTNGNLSWINLGSVAGTINLTSQVSNILPIANGGTNSSTALTNGQLMYSNAGAIKELGVMTDGQIIVGKSASAPQIVSMNGDVTINNTGATTVGKINGTTISGVGLANNNVLQNTSGSAIAGNSVLVSNGTGTGVTALSTPVSGILTSTGGSVPNWSSISSDTFTQYALLAGRSGGQTINGGTAASNNLTLDSTSNATKGNVLINQSGGNVGIGTSAPSSLLEISSSLNSSTGIQISTPGTQNAQGVYTFYSSKSDGTFLGSTVNNRGWAFGSRGDAYTSEQDHLIAGYWNGSVWSIPFRITSTGNVGIGTTNPKGTGATSLDIGSAGAMSFVSMGVEGSYLGFNTYYNGGWKYKGNGMASFLRQDTTGLGLYSAPNNASGADAVQAPVLAMTLSPSGSVGIGTAIPSDKLEIGDGTISNVLSLYGNATGSKQSWVRLSDKSGTLLGISIGYQNTDKIWLDGNGNTYFNGGNVGIGTTNPGAKLEVNGSEIVDGGISATGFYQTTGGAANGSNGNIVSTGGNNAACYNAGWGFFGSCVSLRKTKENIADLKIGLETVLKLRPVSFQWKNNKEHDIGFIAEEVEQVDPILAEYNKNKLSGVRYHQMPSLLVKAIQQLYTRVVELLKASQKNSQSIFAVEISMAKLTAENAELSIKVNSKDRAIDSLRAENAALKGYLCGKDPGAPFCK
ncbi:MAG: tail fiber domain-containing protein [Bdellovibrio sp.]